MLFNRTYSQESVSPWKVFVVSYFLIWRETELFPLQGRDSRCETTSTEFCNQHNDILSAALYFFLFKKKKTGFFWPKLLCPVLQILYFVLQNSVTFIKVNWMLLQMQFRWGKKWSIILRLALFHFHWWPWEEHFIFYNRSEWSLTHCRFSPHLNVTFKCRALLFARVANHYLIGLILDFEACKWCETLAAFGVSVVGLLGAVFLRLHSLLPQKVKGWIQHCAT